jgi:hypothetical protein
MVSSVMKIAIVRQLKLRREDSHPKGAQQFRLDISVTFKSTSKQRKFYIVFISSCKIGGHLDTVAPHAFVCLFLHLCFFNNTDTICKLGQCNSNTSIFKISS